MSFVQSKDLAMRLARVAKPGNVVSLQCRLAPAIFLKCVIAMQTILFIKIVADVTRPLIYIHRCGSRAAKTVGSDICMRN